MASESDCYNSDTRSEATVRFGLTESKNNLKNSIATKCLIHIFPTSGEKHRFFEMNLRPMESDAFIIVLFAFDSDYDEI